MARRKRETGGSDVAPRRRGVLATGFSWLLVIAWAAVIFSMSAQQSTGLSSGFTGQVREVAVGFLALLGLAPDSFSVICHFAEYLVFGALLANAFSCRLGLGKSFLLALACASVYGAGDEFHQYFVPTRMCDPLDWLTDTLGAALGSFACVLALRRRR
ncbi:MAG: VanZ family protein [Coriobacteriaceae bacterium]|nr:VanZ family protein [Coriobacteriaceae bacterium]MDY3799350.1 VanZ family protein [Eggerthellaceae bacterium]MDD6636069.1 VanZ family protein [Coriobacteriaceae bacterium]MDD7430986.1 VanZ family protein [Coriobacteriaceae bacterium]MDO4498125.1 VanZ family protein [Coriobacteriaceae bacterium]